MSKGEEKERGNTYIDRKEQKSGGDEDEATWCKSIFASSSY